MNTKGRGHVTPAMIEAIRRGGSEGLSRDAIAARLGLAPTTVGAYLADPARYDATVVRMLRDGVTQAEVIASTGQAQEYVSKVNRSLEGEAAARRVLAGGARDDDGPFKVEAAAAEPPEAKDEGGIRARVLRVLARHGQQRDTDKLLYEFKRDGGNVRTGLHEMQHVVRSLGKQGLVEFTETRRGTNQTILANIALTASAVAEAKAIKAAAHVGGVRAGTGVGIAARVDEEHEGPSGERVIDKATLVEVSLVAHDCPSSGPGKVCEHGVGRATAVDTDDVVRAREIEGVKSSGWVTPDAVVLVPTEPAPEPDRYPLLAELIRRSSRGAERGRLLRAAAELADDDGQRQEIEVLALEAEQPRLSALELEFIAYAREHRRTA